MLLDIQSIPDLRPCQTPAPDIDSIRCPDFNRQRPVTSSYNRSTTSTMRSDHTSKHSAPPLSPINGHSGSTTHDSFFDSSFGSTEVPYHARLDSKPFSYGAPFSSTRYNNETVSNAQTPQTPPSPSIHRRDSRDTLGSTRVGLESPRLVRKMVGNVGANPGDGRSRRSPSPDSIARMGSLKRERSQTLTTKIMANASESPTNTLGRSSSMTRSASRLDDDVVDSSYGHDSLSRSQSMNASWLQAQQMKLLERREARVRADRGPREARMMSELRSRMNQHPPRESSDGYMSDTTLFSETSRETSPLKSFPPLTINTTAAQSPQKPPIAHSTPARGNSAPSSPVMPPRNFSNIHQGNYSTLKGVSRKHSDISHDRERAFVSVKRAHDMSRSEANSGDEWQSDMEGSGGVHRPITPAFPPATPTTPYLNQGLPPKSPTLQRKEYNSLRSSSPFGQHLRHEINGHGSPAPSLYHGQSRRSSLTSLNDSDVISSHPKLVKDISKFWYKPSISRDDAITILREKSPGTFVVRDSNSFPGAFGLALKVSTPPPNVTSKSSDPTNELVRHFLIEPTSRGVRLKGCANEPVFGSLSALVYQHSITALALPCRLILPDRDPEGHANDLAKPDPKTDTAHLLQQGAACTVLYLFSTDTESLTGPQAIKRAVQVMLASKACPVVVHFKVSAQGITLTDSTRQLFFRRHYPVNAVSHCGLDPDDRRWPQKDHNGDTIGSLRMFGFVAKKGSSRTENQCHILAELEAEQPATAICNFVTKVMMTSINRAKLL